MVSVKFLLFFATTALAAAISSAPKAKRIYFDLVALDDSVFLPKNTIANYTGDIIPAVPILSGITAVHLANRKGHMDANLVGNQTLADNKIIVDYVRDTLAHDIPESVIALGSKKGLFEKGGLDSTVLSSLDLLKYDWHDTLSAALAAKIQNSLYPEADEAAEAIDVTLSEKIETFSS